MNLCIEFLDRIDNETVSILQFLNCKVIQSLDWHFPYNCWKNFSKMCVLCSDTKTWRHDKLSQDNIGKASETGCWTHRSVCTSKKISSKIFLELKRGYYNCKLKETNINIYKRLKSIFQKSHYSAFKQCHIEETFIQRVQWSPNKWVYGSFVWLRFVS